MKKILRLFAKFKELGLEPYTGLDIQVFSDGSYNISDNNSNTIISDDVNNLNDVFDETTIVKELQKLYDKVSNFADVPLNSINYPIARIDENGIKVGCVTVSFEEFDAISQAVDKVRANMTED